MANMSFNPKEKKDWMSLFTLLGVIANAVLQFVFGG